MPTNSKKTVATLFKYRSLNGDNFRYTQDIFLRNRLFLVDYNKLNDPTEGCYRHKANFIASETEDTYYLDDSPLIPPSDNSKITCFSEDPRNSLMWSHYSNYHKGICLGFKKTHIESIAELYKVKYNQRVPTPPESSSIIDKSIKGLQTKSKAWDYEKEWRIINLDGSEFIKLPPNTITQVIFGVNTPDEDIEWVKDWIKITGSKIKLKAVEFSGHAAKMHIYNLDE